jgi:hypothetical protein
MPLFILPDDLLATCLANVEVRVLVRSSAVCRTLRRVTSREELWRSLCVLKYPSVARLSGVASYRALFVQRAKRHEPHLTPLPIALSDVQLVLDYKLQWRTYDDGTAGEETISCTLPLAAAVMSIEDGFHRFEWPPGYASSSMPGRRRDDLELSATKFLHCSLWRKDGKEVLIELQGAGGMLMQGGGSAPWEDSGMWHGKIDVDTPFRAFPMEGRSIAPFEDDEAGAFQVSFKVFVEFEDGITESPDQWRYRLTFVQLLQEDQDVASGNHWGEADPSEDPEGAGFVTSLGAAYVSKHLLPTLRWI